MTERKLLDVSTEKRISRTWYLGASAAAGALAAIPAEATIIHVVGPFAPGMDHVVVQGDSDARPSLNLLTATSSEPGLIQPGSFPGSLGSGQLRFWNTGAGVGRSASRSVGGGATVFFATYAGIAFQSGTGSSYGSGVLANGAIFGNNNYVGFLISGDPNVNGGGTVYGWVQIDLPSTPAPNSIPATIVAFAYQDDGSPISLGDTGAAIPEPSTLGLLALGATGLVALRRRKSLLPSKN